MRSLSIIARLMGLDVLPPQSPSHRRSSKREHKFKDVYKVLDTKKAESSRNLSHHQGKVNATNLDEAKKRLSTDEKLMHSKELHEELEALDSNKNLLLKFLEHPNSLFTKHLLELKPTSIVVLKPKLGGDRRLPCSRKHARQRSNEEINFSRYSKETSKIRKASLVASGSDSASETGLKQEIPRTRNAVNRSLPSSMSKEARKRLTERWKVTHNYEQEIEISTRGTLAEMLATSDRETKTASSISTRSESNAHWSEFQEPVEIRSRDCLKRSFSRNDSKSKTIKIQESTTIVLPKELSPSKDANSDTEESSASYDRKTNKIQETLCGLVTRKEEKPSKDDVEDELHWLGLEDEVDAIGRELEAMLIIELIEKVNIL